MGQYWMIGSPSAENALHHMGKLGELLFDGSPQCLVELLAVPVRCQHYVAANTVGRWELVPKPSLFSSLPTEVHCLVFDNLDIEDVLNLSLTNQYFFSVGERYIHAHYMSVLGQWAGEKIVCVSDESDARDYPPAMLTGDDEHGLSKHQDEYGRSLNLYEFMEKYYKNVQDYSSLRTLIIPFLYGRLRRELYLRVSDAICPPLEAFYPCDQPWILRNLTTKEFVRAEAIALKPEHIHGPFIDFLGFGEVIVSRICWSTDPSVNMVNDTDIHRGIWAAHKFEITTFARHATHTQHDEWKDISEEVAREIDHIWRSEYGPDWRECVEDTIIRCQADRELLAIEEGSVKSINLGTELLEGSW